jgi:hypothetical protein
LKGDDKMKVQIVSEQFNNWLDTEIYRQSEEIERLEWMGSSESAFVHERILETLKKVKLEFEKALTE